MDAERECNLVGHKLHLHESMFVWLRLNSSSVVVLDMSSNNLCLTHPGSVVVQTVFKSNYLGADTGSMG